jgi:hypothetical protein
MLLSNGIRAAELVDFSREDLGIPWGARPEELQKRFPGTAPMASTFQMYRYRGPLSIGGYRLDRQDVMFRISEALGLSSIECLVPNAASLPILRKLKRSLGEGRSATRASGADLDVNQYFAWMTPAHSVQFSYTAESAQPMSEPATAAPAQLRLEREAPNVTWVDGVLAGPKAHVVRPAPVQLALPIAVNTWGAKLNPKGQVPKNGFQAYYIRSNQPETLIATELVDDIAINYAYAEFHAIDSQAFGAYWVGRLDFRSPEIRMINVSLSWSAARVIIDGKIAYDGTSNDRRIFQFSKGSHLVEVEFTNHWHTTEFRVTFDRQLRLYKAAEVRGKLARNRIVNPSVYAVSVYESKSKDLSIRLLANRKLSNAVLVLSSYSPVRWNIDDAVRSGVKAIIYNSGHPSTNVTGLHSERLLLLPVADSVGRYDAQADPKSIEQLTGGRLASSSTAYGGSEFILPDTSTD